MEGDSTPVFSRRSKRVPRQTANVVCDDDDEEYLEVPKFKHASRKSELKPISTSKVIDEDPDDSDEVII